MSNPSFAVQACPFHPSMQWTQFCLQTQTIKRVCPQCERTDCSSHPHLHISRTNFITYLYKDISNLKLLQDRAIARHKQISQLQHTFQKNYDQQDQQTIAQLKTIMQKEIDQQKQIHSKIQALRKRMTQMVKLHRYFQFMGNHSLYDLKFNLSSSKGLRLFQQKVSVYRRSFNRKVQFAKIAEELQLQQQKLVTLRQSSLTKQLTSICSQFKHKQKKRSNSTKQCQSRISYRPKTVSTKSLKQIS